MRWLRRIACRTLARAQAHSRAALSTPGEYNKELLFAVPRTHEEIARLEAEAAAAGGLREGAIVQLANGQAAVIRKVDDDTVRGVCAAQRLGPAPSDVAHCALCLQVLLDCNHPLAGAPLTFTLTVTALERAHAAA